MRHLPKMAATTAILAISAASSASAGGVDRSGQGIGALFETGTYAEFSVGFVSPSVSGTYPGLGGVSSGGVGVDYFQLGAAYKRDFGEKLAFALIIDQPFGADIDYPTVTAPPGVPTLSGTSATLSTYAITGLLQYKVNDSFSLYAGPRFQSASAEVSVPLVGGYEGSTNTAFGIGYSAGAAYERKDIALRVSLTYNSEVTHDWDTTESTAATTLNSTFEFVTPQSVNLDFQTGIMADTLLFGSVRWVNWDGVNVTPDLYLGATGGSLVSFDSNTFTYSLGVGRRINDRISVALSGSYEAKTGGIAPNLGPTDGSWNIGLGGSYQLADNVKLTGGLRYVGIGSATSSGIGGANGDFSGNSAIAAGLKVGINF